MFLVRLAATPGDPTSKERGHGADKAERWRAWWWDLDLKTWVV